VLLSSTVVGALLAGFACGTQEARNREELKRFLASPRLSVCAYGLAAADSYALIDRDLRRQGRPLPTNASWAEALP
jgi:predicted nucleic acid-binding protein